MRNKDKCTRVPSLLASGRSGQGKRLCVCVCLCVCARVCVCVCHHSLTCTKGSSITSRQTQAHCLCNSSSCGGADPLPDLPAPSVVVMPALATRKIHRLMMMSRLIIRLACAPDLQQRAHQLRPVGRQAALTSPGIHPSASYPQHPAVSAPSCLCLGCVRA